MTETQDIIAKIKAEAVEACSGFSDQFITEDLVCDVINRLKHKLIPFANNLEITAWWPVSFRLLDEKHHTVLLFIDQNGQQRDDRRIKGRRNANVLGKKLLRERTLQIDCCFKILPVPQQPTEIQFKIEP